MLRAKLKVSFKGTCVLFTLVLWSLMKRCWPLNNSLRKNYLQWKAWSLFWYRPGHSLQIWMKMPVCWTSSESIGEETRISNLEFNVSDLHLWPAFLIANCDSAHRHTHTNRQTHGSDSIIFSTKVEGGVKGEKPLLCTGLNGHSLF